MKDEELAEEYANNIDYTKTVKIFDCVPYHENCDVADMVAQGFLAGLKAGRPQWHDLRKDPNDLPKEDKYYLIVTKLNNYYISRFRGTCWIGKCNAYVSEDMVVAWCEIPTFDKE